MGWTIKQMAEKTGFAVDSLRYYDTLSEIKTVTTTLFQEPSAKCNRINKDLLQCKRTELTESIQNFKSIIKFIDKVQPMLDDADAFMKNAGEIQGFIQSIYDNIRKTGWALVK